MSKTSVRTVCRLCGGSGLPQPLVAPARKPAALLCTAYGRPPVDVVVLLPRPLPRPLPLAA